MAYIKRCWAIVAIFISLCITQHCVVYAVQNPVSVFVRLEGIDETYANGYVMAETFLEAVQRLGSESDISVLIRQNSQYKEIYAVNGIENNKAEDLLWRGYIVRDGEIFISDDLLSAPLIENDEVVLYYGDSDTKIIASLKKDIQNGKLRLSAIQEYVQWSYTDNGVISKTVEKPISSVKVVLSTPDGLQQISLTDNTGKVTFDCYKTGYYEYYAQGYQDGQAPIMVKLAPVRFLNGVEDETALTRSEFAALLMHSLTSQRIPEEVSFTDIEGHNDEAEIRELIGLGLMSGYDDGTFQPEKKISRLEAIVVLARCLPEKNYEMNTSLFMQQPLWAVESLRKAEAAGLITDEESYFSDTLSIEEFTDLLTKLSDLRSNHISSK